MATMLEYYRDLAEQLAAMPGGHVNLRTAYFGTVTRADPVFPSTTIIEGWMLQEGGALALVHNGNGNAALVWLRHEVEESMAVFTPELLQAAREYSLTPLGLALLALAMGGVDDSRLKARLPELHKASKGLLLIAVCRLCG